MRWERNLVYATTPHGPLEADLLIPEEPRGVIYFLHGGGWVTGDRTMWVDVLPFFAKQGWAAATVSYRLAPAAPFPAAVVDARRFARWLRDDPARYGLGGLPVVVAGNSAGGHLAAMTALCQDEIDGETGVVVDGFISMNPITDLTHSSVVINPVCWDFILPFLGGMPDEFPDRYARASPVHFVAADSPPGLLIHGTADDLVPFEQSERLHRALLNAGAECELLALPGEAHSFSMAAFERTLAAMSDFLASRVGPA